MVLVTGGTGLVGSHLLLELVRSGTKVRAIYRTEHKLAQVKKTFSYYTADPQAVFDKIEWIQADILDIPALEIAFIDIHYVYHAAALISFDPNDFDTLRKINVEGTANIVNLCVAYKVKKLCYVSTIGTIGRSLPNKKATEENEWTAQRTNVYALTKYAAEMEVWRGSQENLEVVIVNPGVILGPGFWETGSGKFFKAANKGSKYYPPGGTGFVTVADVVRIMIGLLKSDIVQERFILVADNLTFKDILTRIALAMKKKPPVKELKIWQLKIGRYLDILNNVLAGNERRITKNTIYSLQHTKVYSNAKIKAALDFEFEDLENTIQLCAEHFISDR
ncbi:NAD-dependent epimerase/dehydratase family protein [Maribacter chungangensis]|uniref:NAD-dependent epimerase/dehydratase family protein n=1 Tax=Maribacter chungangensis TaxID=1069117 RepID=A0ABW3B6V2_9FLAO